MTAPCPVCWKHITPTSNRNIFAHRDKAGRRCPASGHPYQIITTYQEEQ